MTEAAIPIVALIVLVGLSFFLFGDAGAKGPNQVALVLAAMIGLVIGRRAGYTAEQLREAAIASVGTGRRRDLHPVRGRRADGRLGDERHADGHGLLRAAAAEPELLLHDDRAHLRHRRLQRRQLLDRGGDDRHRAGRHRPSTWTSTPRSQRGQSSPGRTSATSRRHCRTPPTSPPRSAARTSTSTCARCCGPSIPALAITLAIFFFMGSPGDFDATEKLDSIRSTFDVSLVHFLPLVVVDRAGGAARAAVHDHHDGCAGRRRCSP